MEESQESLVHSTLQQIRKLRLRGDRQRTGLHFIEGFRSFLQAADAHLPMETLLYSETLARNPAVQKRVRLSKRFGTPVVRVRPEQFRTISGTPHASGIGAILRQHWTPLEQLDPRQGLCWIAVSRLRSPGNLGTILRTAEAVGAAGMIFTGDETDPFDPSVVRASMGGIFHQTLSRTSLPNLAEWCRRHGCNVVGTSPSAAELHTQVPVDPPLVILFGDERKGMSTEEVALCSRQCRIPIVGRADSLNVAVAAGVMLYEVMRRRQG